MSTESTVKHRARVFCVTDISRDNIYVMSGPMRFINLKIFLMKPKNKK